MSAGRVSAGGVVSTTNTLKKMMAMLFAASRAVHVTCVVPRWKSVPLAGAHTTGTGPSRLSMAVTVYVTTAPDALVASAVTDPGALMTGGCVSPTVTRNEPVEMLAGGAVAGPGGLRAGGWFPPPVTRNEPVEMLPEESVARHCTSVTPSGKSAPEI